MASSGLQLVGFLLSLAGIAATLAAVFMVDWKKQHQGKGYRSYEGLWMSCSGGERLTCELHESLLKLPAEVQATRSVLLLSIILSSVALVVSTVGMKCTRFMETKVKSKIAAAIVGGILFIISGLLTIVVTSWYVRTVVLYYYKSQTLHRYEFSKAVFVSWTGGVLTVAGGTFLTCRRCSRSSMNSDHLHVTPTPGSQYV